MKNLKMARGVTLTFEEGCEKYLEYCRQRNLRQGTINHYKQSYVQFYKFFDPKMPIEDIDEQIYKDYVLYLKSTLDNDVSTNSYLRDLITTIHFFMNEGWIPHFKINPLIEECLKPNIVRTGINFAGSPVLFMNLRNLYVSLLLQQMCAEIQNKHLTSLLV